MAKAETAGFSQTRLQLLDKVMKERYVDSGLLNGIHTQIFRRGELVHNGLAGLMDIERNKSWREDAIIRIYSMTKPITAVALMMLVEEGKIGLDDNVYAHIPSWKNLGVYQSGVPSLVENTAGQFITSPCDRPMKIIDLLTHTSGLTYGFMRRTLVDGEYRRQKIADRQTEGGLEGMIEQLSKIPLDFSPGTKWNYSVSIEVVGYLVQKCFGMTLGEFLRTRIFEPLGMWDTSFSVPASKLDRFASCYMPKEGGGLQVQDDSQKSTYAEWPKLESGGGGLVSTMHDYMLFCRMMLAGGTLDGAQILSPKTVQLFSMNFLPNNQLLSDMSVTAMFSEAGFNGTRLFARLRRDHGPNADAHARHAG